MYLSLKILGVKNKLNNTTLLLKIVQNNNLKGFQLVYNFIAYFWKPFFNRFQHQDGKIIDNQIFKIDFRFIYT